MAKIYGGMQGIPVPEWNSKISFADFQKIEDAYIERIKTEVKSMSSGEYVGEEISFPYADGSARYIVKSIKPLELIHLSVGDAWEYPYIERLTKKDIVAVIEQNRRRDAFFSARK